MEQIVDKIGELEKEIQLLESRRARLAQANWLISQSI